MDPHKIGSRSGTTTRDHMPLDEGETPAEAHARKMPPRGHGLGRAAGYCLSGARLQKIKKPYRRRLWQSRKYRRSPLFRNRRFRPAFPCLGNTVLHSVASCSVPGFHSCHHETLLPACWCSLLRLAGLSVTPMTHDPYGWPAVRDKLFDVVNNLACAHGRRTHTGYINMTISRSGFVGISLSS